ncbi:MAG: hypothetical protein ABJN40_20155 [Sneathiella sp.]
MSTNQTNRLSREHVPNVKDSDYEFNRYDKACLRETVGALKLFTNSANWKDAAPLIFNAVKQRFSSKGLNVYCFIASPEWKKDTRIVRHYGLGRALGREFKVGPLDISYEKEIVDGDEVIFYGMVKLTAANAKSVFELLSVYENGVLFSSKDMNDPNLNCIVGRVAELLASKPKTSTLSLNIVEAINVILKQGSEALFPYAWEETGEYHLDIFTDR